MKETKIKVPIGVLRKIIREELERRMDEMAATPEPFNRKQLGAAAAQGMEKVKAAAIEWIENMWGLGQSSGDEAYKNYAKQANQVLGQLLKKAPVFQSAR